MFKAKKADWYFIVLTLLVWISGLIVTAWDFIQIQKATYAFTLLNLVGLVLTLAGVVIWFRARWVLGRYYSIVLMTLKEHKLVKNDIYKSIRHPIYSGKLLLWPGVPLSLSSLYGFLVMLLLIPCLVYRIRIEEKMLIEKFGNEYIEYMKDSKKLIPYIY